MPEASKVKSSPSHITSLVAPLTKLTTGKAAESTVTVTTLDVALAKLEGTGHVLEPKVTYAKRLKAVVIDNGAGSKFKFVAPGMSTKLPVFVLLCH